MYMWRTITLQRTAPSATASPSIRGAYRLPGGTMKQLCPSERSWNLAATGGSLQKVAVSAAEHSAAATAAANQPASGSTARSCGPITDTSHELELLARQLSGSTASTSSSNPWQQDLRATVDNTLPEFASPDAQQQQQELLRQQQRQQLQLHLQSHQQRKRRPRYSVASKLKLKPEEAMDISQRLRVPRVPPGCTALRVFR